MYIQNVIVDYYHLEEGFINSFTEMSAAQNAQSKPVLDDIFSRDFKTWINFTGCVCTTALSSSGATSSLCM
ncbi:hypothetical protein PG996_014622 [Apiospora saccharicola]|uniref:Uncharacterized protein n=1 Tax=Apiospora saccharicola TaxID=335842 RepID=A0ABR1TIU7_9PEZI